MIGTFFNVSGIDPNAGARIVFVWGRDKGSDEYVLLGSGHVVGTDGSGVPPGVLAGQFSVVFQLPDRCSSDHIAVTDDKSGKEFLRGVVVTPCGSRSGFQSGAALASSNTMAAASSTG
jgi:hypothetical protein